MRQQSVSGMSAGTLKDMLKTCFSLLASCNTWIVLSKRFQYRQHVRKTQKHLRNWEILHKHIRKKCFCVDVICFYLSIYNNKKELLTWIYVFCEPTCCRNDAVAALTTETREQARLPSTCQTNAHHIIFWSWRRGSFTAQCPETLKR